MGEKMFKKSNQKLVKKIFASIMLPMFVFQMSSLNFLLLNVAYATEGEAPVVVQESEVVAEVEEAVFETISEVPEEPVEKVELTKPVVTIEEVVVPEIVEPVKNEEKKTEKAEKEVTWDVKEKVATIAPVKIGEKYVAPQNEGVTVTFSKLPANPGSLTIEEITLTDEQIAELGALSDKAYDITSNMENGTFKYDLTLPKPENKNNVQIKFAESAEGLKEAEIVSDNDVETKSEEVNVELDHMTVFVVVAPNPVNTDCTGAGVGIVGTDTCYNSIQSAIDAASDGDTINVAAGTYALDSQIRISKELDIIGAGDSTIITKGVADWTNSTGSKGYAPLITITSGNKSVKLEKFKVTGAKNIAMLPSGTDYGSGINVVSSADVTLKDITLTANAAAGLIVNSSTVKADNLNTSLNGWNAGVNVDKKDSGDTEFTLTGSGVISESTQIYSDTTVGVDVDANGYTAYKIGGGTVTVWTNRSLQNAATITKNDSTTLYKTIQAAIDGAVAGDTVNVYPGDYVEKAESRTILAGTPQAQGPHQFGLFLPIDKPGLKLVGVDEDGEPITDANSSSLPFVKTKATNNFGTSGIWVEGANDTIQGIKVGNNESGNNKTFEVVADNFTLQYVKTDVSDGGGSVYINDFSTEGNVVKAYHIKDNIFPDGTSVDLASGAGLTGPVSDREILRNTFDLGNNGYNAISFSGSGGVAWFVTPVGGAIIKDNHFSHSTQYIRARGVYDNSQFDWKSYWNDNTFDKAVVALKDANTFDVRDYSYTSGSATFSTVRRIGSAIQPEIGNAQSGDTIKVAKGEYTEAGQVVIDKDLSIIGADKNTVIIKPAQDTGNGGDSRGWFLVNSGKSFTLKDVTLDGSGKLINIGILSHGPGTIENNIIKNIGYNASGPDYSGRGVAFYDANATIKNNLIQNFGRIGLYTYGSSATVTIDGNIIKGKGEGNHLDYGIEIEGGAHAIITNNDISKCSGVASVDGSTSAGILATTYFAPGTQATITGNTISECTDGIVVGYDATDTSVVVAHKNKLGGNVNGVNSTKPLVDATDNWWGHESGPKDVISGDESISETNPGGEGSIALGAVKYAPWYTDEAMTKLTSPNAITKDATNITLNDATLNGANGDYNATGHSFWVSLTSFATTSPNIPSGVYSTPDFGSIGANEEFNKPLSLVTTQGIHFNMPAITPNTTYYYVAWSRVGNTWYPGEMKTFTTSAIVPPSVPKNGQPHNTYKNTNNFDFTWDASTDDSSPITYEFQSSLDSAQTDGILTAGLWKSDVLPSNMIHSSGAPDGKWYWQVRAIDENGNKSAWSEIWNMTIDTHAPATPTGIYFKDTANNKDVSCGGFTAARNFDVYWNANTESDFDHYEYISYNADGSAGLVTTFTAPYFNASWWTVPTEGTYGVQIKAVDKAENKSAWYGGAQGINNSCKYTADWAAPTVDIIFAGTGSGVTGFQAKFSENVKKAEAENPANYFLNNWPGAGGSGDLVGDAAISYDEVSKTATITFTNSGWYVSPEQEWGVQNVHDLAGNLQSVNPYKEYSTLMVAPITTDSGIDTNWHNSSVTVNFSCTDTNGSGCKTTYYTTDGNVPTISSASGSSVVLSTDGIFTIKYFSVDNAGNSEGVKTALKTVKIDKTAPGKLTIVKPSADQYFKTSPIRNEWNIGTDTGSGIAQYRVEYIYDDGHTFSGAPYRTTTSTWRNHAPAINEQGGVKIRVQAIDNVGNEGEWSDQIHYFYDVTAPIATISYDKTSWTNGSVVATLNPNEPVTVTNNSGNTTHTFTDNGAFTFEFNDAAGNIGTALATVNIIDKIAPIFVGKTTFSGWHKTAQTSVFKYADTNMAEGYSDLTCEINTEGASQTCSVTPNVCDKAGNCNTTATTSHGANIDKTLPISTIDGGENGDTIFSNSWNGTFSGTASDNLSEVEKVELKIQRNISGVITYWNGEDWQPEEKLVPATGTTAWTYGSLDLPLLEGEYDIESHATDKAGNTENTYKLKIIFDKTIPEINLAINPTNPNGDNEWYDSIPEISLNATDSVALDKIEYQIDSQAGTWATYNAPVTIAEGQHIFYYRSLDKAGNYSNVGIKNVKVDISNPDTVEGLDADYDEDDDIIKLDWRAQDTDIHKVHIYRGTHRSFDINSTSRIAENADNDNEITDRDISRGEKYYYKLVSIDEAGNKSDAKVISVEIPATGGEAIVTDEGTESVPESATEGEGNAPENQSNEGAQDSNQDGNQATGNGENDEGRVAGAMTSQEGVSQPKQGRTWPYVGLAGAGGLFAAWHLRRRKLGMAKLIHPID